MTNHWLPVNTDAQDITKDQSVTTEHTQGVRVYRDAPGSVVLQLRSFGPITYPGKGKPRRMIMSTTLVRRDIEAVIAALQIELAELS